MLPFVKFDKSGNARIRFFGVPLAVGWHYAKVNLSPLRIVCPNSFAAGRCKMCRDGATPSSRSMAKVWDCIAKRWAIYIGPYAVFAEAWEKSKSIGSSREMMEKGDGPDVLLQRIGMRTEVEICPETIGDARGNGNLPSLDELMDGLGKASVWNKFGTVAEVEQKYGWEKTP
jgi:hypothetical protein